MIAVKESAIYLSLTGDHTEIGRVSDALMFKHPDCWRADSHQLWIQTDGKLGWDGYIRLIKRDPKTSLFKIQRGHKVAMIEAADKLGITLDLAGLIKPPFDGLTADDIPTGIVKSKFDVDDSQRLCVASWLNACHGIHRMVVSSGKTVTFAAAAAMLKKRLPKARFLYITPTERLVNQVFKEVTKFLPEWDITQFGGGKRNYDGKDMVVATMASIWANIDELVAEKWTSSFMALLYDECHHACSPTAEKVLLSIPAFFRFGASDTVHEKDIIKRVKVRGLIGPLLEQVNASPLIKIGRIAKPTIYVVDVPEWENRFSDYGHAADPETPAWVLIDGEWKSATYMGPAYVPAEPNIKTGEYKPGEEDGIARDKKGEKIQLDNMHTLMIDGVTMELSSRWCLLDRLSDVGIIRFKERNAMITRWAKYFSDGGRPTVIVATRTLHILVLQANVAKAVGEDKVKILFSDHTTKERDSVFEWLKTTPGSVLITPLVQEGVSIPELGNGIVADHVVNHERMSQIIGRFIRKKPKGKNEAAVVIFIDRQHPKLRRNGLHLMQELEKIKGYDFVSNVQGPETKDNGILFKSEDYYA